VNEVSDTVIDLLLCAFETSFYCWHQLDFLLLQIDFVNLSQTDVQVLCLNVLQRNGRHNDVLGEDPGDMYTADPIRVLFVW